LNQDTRTNAALAEMQTTITYLIQRTVNLNMEFATMMEMAQQKDAEHAKVIAQKDAEIFDLTKFKNENG